MNGLRRLRWARPDGGHGRPAVRAGVRVLAAEPPGVCAGSCEGLEAGHSEGVRSGRGGYRGVGLAVRERRMPRAPRALEVDRWFLRLRILGPCFRGSLLLRVLPWVVSDLCSRSFPPRGGCFVANGVWVRVRFVHLLVFVASGTEGFRILWACLARSVRRPHPSVRVIFVTSLFFSSLDSLLSSSFLH